MTPRSRSNGTYTKSIAVALERLAEPIAPRAVRFKIQSQAGGRCQVVAYVDARTVYDRLDAVCAGAWKARFRALDGRLWPTQEKQGEEGQVAKEDREARIYVHCDLTVCGVTRGDVGEGADPKAAYSDAVKRAAVQFGIARCLYAIRSPWLSLADDLATTQNGCPYIPPRTEERLRQSYAAWLRRRRNGAAAGAGGEPSAAGDGQAIALAAGAGETEEVRVEAGALKAEEPAPETHPPATALDRGQLLKAGEDAGFGEALVIRLAEFVCGAMFDRLAVEQLTRIEAHVAAAAKAGIGARSLTAALTELEKEEDRDKARRALAEKIAGRRPQVAAQCGNACGVGGAR